MKHTILCVDDEIDNVEALERLFRKKYRVLKATSGPSALDLLKKESVSLIISDQRMPGLTGVEFLSQTVESHPDTIRILLTGYTDIESVIAAINSGQVYRYVTKPWDPRDLELTVEKAIEKYELRSELKKKNQALSQALEDLKLLDQAKSQFMILINHELKTPLTSLLSFLELVHETKLDDEQKKYLSRITKSAERLKEIVFDVLELMSAEMGITKLEIRPVSLHPAFEKISDEFHHALQERGLTVDYKFEAQKVLADERVLLNIIRRIFSNAVRFADSPSQIRVTAKNRDTKTALIAIENQGAPIPPEIVEKILKPFAINENIMNHSKGLGLGLSLSQALLKCHRSVLNIESRGRTISVSFPLPVSS